MISIGEAVIGPNGTQLPLSAGIRVGDLLFLSGQLALKNGRIVGETVLDQTHIIFDMIETLLSAANLSLSDVVKTTVWLSRAEDFSSFNEAYASRLKSPYPARSTVVSALLAPGALIEIEIIAHG